MSSNGAAALSAGGSLFGSIAGGLFNMGQQTRANAFNDAMYRRALRDSREDTNLAYERSLEQWHRENAYNDPSAQMQRLKDAGINPNFAVGGQSAVDSGSGSGFSQVGKADAPSPPKFQSMMEGQQMFGSLSNMAMQLAQIDKVYSENEYIRSKTENEKLALAFQTLANPLSIREKEHNLFNLEKYSSDIQAEKLQQLKLSNDSTLQSLQLNPRKLQLAMDRLKEDQRQFDARTSQQNQHFDLTHKQREQHFTRNLSNLMYQFDQQMSLNNLKFQRDNYEFGIKNASQIRLEESNRTKSIYDTLKLYLPFLK